MAYKGKFSPRNSSKYRGNIQEITYRSNWERCVMKWCDENSAIEWWSSEETIIPYLSPADGTVRRYFIDFTIKFKGKNPILVEVKPLSQTAEPKKRRKTKKYINEVATYGVNQAKWAAARQFAAKHNTLFMIWTEETLKKLGIKII